MAINKPLSLSFLAIYLMLFHHVTADTVSFSYNKFSPKQNDLIFQGDASAASNQVLQLTKVDSKGNPLGSSVGRVLYSAPIRLFDSSALVSSFETTFTFTISSPSGKTPGDGLAFFIATPETTIPPNSGGAFLGLFSASNALNNSRNELLGFKASSDKVFAVEFDTYPNTNIGDPNYRHVGIDINSIKSSAVATWNFQNAGVATAHVSYNSVSRRVSVVTSYPNSSPVTVTYDVNLSTVLPEWVRVGFSASTGLYSQTNNLLSWSFRANVIRAESGTAGDADGYIQSVV